MFRPLPMLAAMTFSALALTATARSQPQPKSLPKASSSTNPRGERFPDQPADLTIAGLTIQQSADRVAVAVRFDARIGLRGVKVRLTVAGGGQVRFERTQLVDMPLNSTQTVTFKVPFEGIKAQIPQEPFQAVRFMTITATADPDDAVGEGDETNNKVIRIVPF